MRFGLYGFVFFLALIAAIGYAHRPFSLRNAAGSAARAACCVQPQASLRRTRNRLPLLPHIGGEILFCEHPAYVSICMNCHSEMWAASPALEPVRESYRTGKSIEWTRVHDLPMFVYFNHSIHVSKGFGCSACHGRVDQMPLTWQSASLEMKWCLDCHRNPEKLRPGRLDQIYNMAWQSPPDQLGVGATPGK